jgi:hypothetical protein
MPVTRRVSSAVLNYAPLAFFVAVIAPGNNEVQNDRYAEDDEPVDLNVLLKLQTNAEAYEHADDKGNRKNKGEEQKAFLGIHDKVSPLKLT